MAWAQVVLGWKRDVSPPHSPIKASTVSIMCQVAGNPRHLFCTDNVLTMGGCKLLLTKPPYFTHAA